MSESCAPHMNWINPILTVADVEQAIAFYQKAFTFASFFTSKGDDGTIWHGELKYHDNVIMLGKEGAWGATARAPKTTGVESPMALYLYCQDVDEFYRHATKNGAVEIMPPEDMFWNDRMCRLKDVDGYIWAFATHLKNVE